MSGKTVELANKAMCLLEYPGQTEEGWKAVVIFFFFSVNVFKTLPTVSVNKVVQGEEKQK